MDREQRIVKVTRAIKKVAIAASLMFAICLLSYKSSENYMAQAKVESNMVAPYMICDVDHTELNGENTDIYVVLPNGQVEIYKIKEDVTFAKEVCISTHNVDDVTEYEIVALK